MKLLFQPNLDYQLQAIEGGFGLFHGQKPKTVSASAIGSLCMIVDFRHPCILAYTGTASNFIGT